MGLTKLAEIAKRYNAAQNDVPRKARQHYQGFDMFTPDNQIAKLAQDRAFVRDDFLPEIDKAILSIADERRSVERALTKAMFPSLSAAEVGQRQLGESQLSSARSFLSTNPDAAAIGREARLSLSLGRIDAAWTLIAAMRDAIPAGGAPVTDDEGRAMERELQETLAAAEGSKVPEIEKELSTFPAVERAAVEVRQQIASGKERVVVAALWPEMNDQERSQARLFVESQGSLLESVHLQQGLLRLYEGGKP